MEVEVGIPDNKPLEGEPSRWGADEGTRLEDLELEVGIAWWHGMVWHDMAWRHGLVWHSNGMATAWYGMTAWPGLAWQRHGLV